MSFRKVGAIKSPVEAERNLREEDLISINANPNFKEGVIELKLKEADIF